VWHLPLEEIRDLIANMYGCPSEVPSDIRKFPEWVRKELFDLECLPRQRLAELYDWASEDLQAIQTNVEACQSAIREVELRSPKTDADPSDIKFYSYFMKLNEDARTEIIGVLTYRDRLRRIALRTSYTAHRTYKALFYYPVWLFRLNEQFFDPAAFSSIRHAFSLSIKELREVERLYRESDKTPFDQYLERYITDAKPTEKIRRLVGEHHLLAARKSILLPVLEAYERNEFALFIGAAATQIEGIIEDACVLSGISLETLRLGSIISKLDELVKDTSIRIDYAYYAFKFPLVRNRIAHGRMLPTNMRDIHLLLLDLYDCCKIVRNHPGAPNALVEFLQRVRPEIVTLADVVEFAIIYAETGGERPNDFYGLDQEFEELTLLLDSQVLWDFLHDLLSGPQVDEIDNGLALIGNRLKNRVPIQRKSCALLLAKLGDRGKGKFDRKNFIAAIRSSPGHDHLVKNLDELRSLFIALLRERERWLRTSEVAYARWEERGRTHGRDWEDWFAAEKKLGFGSKR
jgi:hypothetical protein